MINLSTDIITEIILQLSDTTKVILKWTAPQFTNHPNLKGLKFPKEIAAMTDIHFRGTFTPLRVALPPMTPETMSSFFDHLIIKK